MACSPDFIDFVCQTLRPLGDVRPRKMMGDYIIYVNEKCVATACDNLVYVKMLPCLHDLMASAEVGRPYDGAKEHYILDLADSTHARAVVSVLWEALPFPPKKKSTNL